MIDDGESIQTLWKWILTVVMAAAVALGKRSITRIDADIADLKKGAKDAEEGTHESALEITKLKLHVSENYANKSEMQASLARIHERMDRLPSEIVALIKQNK